MDDSTWLALTIVLTVVGAAVTWLAWRRRGAAPAMRAAGITMLVPAAYLTGALPLVVTIGREVGSWAAGLVFSPVVWTGAGLGVLGVLLFWAGGSMMSRGKGITARPGSTRESAPRSTAGGESPKKVAPGSGPAPGAPSGSQDKGDEGMDDIEAILRKRGIT